MEENFGIYKLIILLAIALFLIILFRNNPTGNVSSQKCLSNSLLLGSNLGVWGKDWYWVVNEPFIKNGDQRKLAKGSITSFRFPCRNISDEGLLIVLDKIEEVEAIPFVVLPPNDDLRSEYVVELFGDRVQYYEYGNEVDWWFGMSPEDHAKRFCEAYPKLKSISPEIKLGGPVQGGADIKHYERWANTLRKNCPKIQPDFISFHKYWAYGTESDRKILRDVSHFSEEIQAIRSSTIEIFGEDLPLIVSEWNWHALPDNYNDNRDMDEEFIREFTNAVIEEMEEADVFMAHQFCYGAGCAGGHLDMVSWDKPKPQYQVFLEKSDKLCSR